MFVPGEPLGMAGHRVVARGHSEVVLYSPDHECSLGSFGVKEVRRVIDLWAARTSELMSRPEVHYVLIFENRGADAGATIPHPHGQIYAFPFVPPVPAREAEIAAIRGCALCAEDPQDRLVGEAAGWRAWVPFASAHPYGMLIAPDRHLVDLPGLPSEDRDAFAAVLADALGRLDRLFDLPFPYMFWIHQGVHLHVHVAPPRRAAQTVRYVAAGELGSGTFMNPVLPESAAEALRNA